MRGKRPRYRVRPFRQHLGPTNSNYRPKPTSAFSAREQPGIRARKIFLVTQASSLESTTGTPKRFRRVLIFDDHPDSLRLVLGREEYSDINLSAPQRVSALELTLVSMLAMGLIGMFWSLL